MTERTLQNKQNTKRSHSLFTNKQTSHVTKAAGIEVYRDLRKWKWKRSRKKKSCRQGSFPKSGSIQDRSL